ncbi:MAG: AEC family transporter [Lachnospiraceae bacterium]|nr:AEC family transporter [Lachnospiraceae bacterium]
MSITVVLQQMVMIFILIVVGLLLYKKEMLSEITSKQISGIIVNVTNPALLICSAFQEGPKVSVPELGMALGIYLIIYILLITLSFLIPRILRVPNMYHYSYQMLTIFGNVGFIGIPLASAVLGAESLIFVSIYNLIYNILIYTFGISLLQKASTTQSGNSDTNITSPLWKKLVNAGTISAAATIIFYLCDFRVPAIVPSTLNYMGQATTLLSMLVLGASVAQMTLKDIFSHPKLYGFTLMRQILVPIGCVLLLRPFIENALILNTMALMLAVPAGNMPLMLSKQLRVETDTISQGIILTTILSLMTIPIVSLCL